MNSNTELESRLESTKLWQEYEKLVKESENKDLKAKDLVTIISVLTGYNLRLFDDINELKKTNVIITERLKSMEKELKKLKNEPTISNFTIF